MLSTTSDSCEVIRHNPPVLSIDPAVLYSDLLTRLLRCCQDLRLPSPTIASDERFLLRGQKGPTLVQKPWELAQPLSCLRDGVSVKAGKWRYSPARAHCRRWPFQSQFPAFDFATDVINCHFRGDFRHCVIVHTASNGTEVTPLKPTYSKSWQFHTSEKNFSVGIVPTRLFRNLQRMSVQVPQVDSGSLFVYNW